MEITKKWLEEQQACGDGVKWFVSQESTDVITVLKKLLKEKQFSWANWLCVKKMTLNQKRQFAVFAAEQVIDIFEKKYPEDKRPRNAIEAAKKVIQNDCEENRKAAASVAVYAADAAASAASATSATYYAASAADAAAYAADAASVAVYAAAYAAASAAYASDAANAADAVKDKIIEYGIILIREG